MWIVELALNRPHTFIVMAIAIALFGIISITGMPIDIFPRIDVPVVSCVWTYTGMSPFNMENLCTSVTERALTSTVNGIDRIESLSVSGMAVVKVFLRQGTPMGQSVAMVTSVGNAILKTLPRSITPPFVCASSATDVPVIQLGLHSDTLTEAELFDIANNFVRSQLATIQGTITPFPYGGKFRQVVIDLDPHALIAMGISAADVVQAVNDQNVVNPGGSIKLGPKEYFVVLNNVPGAIDRLNDIPIKNDKGAVVFLRDVAQAHDGYLPQLNVVNHDGKRSVLFNILKAGNASTLTVVDRVKQFLPYIRSIVPPACKIDVLVDQSTFVRECIAEVVREAATAAGLTALMMLALLGSWRSTLIVAISIPLAILSATIGLNVLGQTINSMTLGGLALAVGMLVDDATVAVENIHQHLDMGKDIIRSILDGAQQVALPALVSTMSICIVFVPVFILTEPSRSLFVPLGLAVVLAMMASYFLSRTIVPLMARYLLASEARGERGERSRPRGLLGLLAVIQQAIERNFEALRGAYHELLAAALERPAFTALLFASFYAASLVLVLFIGKDYFPAIDSGQLRIHLSAPPGTRVEETERLFRRVEKAIRRSIPSGEIASITDNIGLPVSAINYAYSDSQTVSEADGEILLSLSEKRPHDTAYYQKLLRRNIKKEFPEATFFFQPADIVTQILNAGLPSPIDVKVASFKKLDAYELARQIKREVMQVPGAVDVCVRQIVNAPQLEWNVDRVKAKEMGLNQNDASNSLNFSLSSSFQLKPNFWVNTANGVSYNLSGYVPQYRIGSTNDMMILPVTPLAGAGTPTAGQTSVYPQNFPMPQLLFNLATLSRKSTPAMATHIDVAPVFDVYAACQDRDLGGVAKEVIKIVRKHKKVLPRGTFVVVAGQVLSMIRAFAALIGGLLFALVLVYLLLVVNFQSWTDPLIILLALPGAFSGILWSLFVTQTNFSIPALMGTIMTIGVASANSILMVTFANEERARGMGAQQAALAAGFQRFRPVIMTATAMIIGMIPMAIGAGQGGSQNAPIGRAVVGGLIVATASTLVFVPVMFSLIRGRAARQRRA